LYYSVNIGIPPNYGNVPFWKEATPIGTIFTNITEAMKAVAQNPKDYINGGRINEIEIHFEATDKFTAYRDCTWILANPYNYYRPFNEGQMGSIFLRDMYSLDGEPLQIHVKSHQPNIGDLELNDESSIYLKQKFPICYLDNDNMRPIVGYIRLGEKIPNTLLEPIVTPLDDVNTYRYYLKDSAIKNGFVSTSGHTEKGGKWYRNADIINNFLGYSSIPNNLLDYYEREVVSTKKTAYGIKIARQKHFLANPGFKTNNLNKIEEFAKPLGFYANVGGVERAWWTRYGLEKNDKNYVVPAHIFIFDESESIENIGALYDKETKEYYTDQKDLNERDKNIDKGKAIRDIITKILVAEGINFAMKGLHYLATRETNSAPEVAVAVASGVAYEGGKRIEGGIAQSLTFKVAKEAYRAYCIWRTTMDLAAEIRSSYQSIGKALKGLKQTSGEIASYYRDFDWKNLSLTNISSVLPAEKIRQFRGNLNHFKYTVNNFDLAVDKLAFRADMLTGGNYGALNSVIDITTEAIIASMRETAFATEALNEFVNLDSLIDNTVAKNTQYNNTHTMNKITNKQKKTTVASGHYISNITALAQAGVQAINVNVLNDEINALTTALLVTELESKSWVNYYDNMLNLPNRVEKEYSNMLDANGKLKKDAKPFSGLAKALNYKGNVFDIYSTENLENLEKNFGDGKIGDGKWNN
jgi:hypothetical protein